MNERKIYHGLRECSTSTGISIEILQLARAHPQSPKGINGFHESGRIYLSTPEQGENTLEKWINENREQLEATTGETREHWLTRRDRANALLAELELEERYNRVVDKEPVKELLDRIATALVSLFNSKLRQELPARINLPPEKIGEIDKVLTELFSVLGKNIEQWK